MNYNAVFNDILLKNFEEHSKNIFRYYFTEDSSMYQTAKRAYYFVRRSL